MRWLGALVVLCAEGCMTWDAGGAPAPATAAAMTTSPHATVVSATACWLGGTWNDATGETTPPVRRCEQTLLAAYGRVEPDRVARLRALEDGEVRALGTRIREQAGASSQADDVGRFYDRVAAAMREEMLARRAADRVKMDTTGPRDRSRRTEDERVGATQLGAATALVSLQTTQLGAMNSEANAIALLLASDRMPLAVDLPKHLKIVAVGQVFAQVFGVSPPALPSDPAAPPVAGTWLGYLSDVARAAQHPVPPALTAVGDRERVAWAGVLEGLADQLRLARRGFVESSALETAVDGVIRRLDIEYRAAEASIGTPVAGRQ